MTDFLDVDATLEDWNALRAANDFQGFAGGQWRQPRGVG